MPRMTGSRLFAEMMKGYGVTHAFFVPTILMKALQEMQTLGLKRIMTHGEKAAAYMADGYARASGRPGLCLAQQIGASNLCAGLKDAFLARVPLIAITGGSTVTSRYRHAYQELEDFSQFDCLTKFNAQVDDETRLPDLLRQAFRFATSGSPGPVHLRLRNKQGDLAPTEHDFDPIVEAEFGSVPPFRPEPEMARVRQAAELLAKAKKPIIVAGGGVAASGAHSELVQLAEKLQIPVATSLNGKGTILDNHPLSVGVVGTYSRTCANRAVCEADLVFFAGSPGGGHVTHDWRVPPRGTTVIQLDIDASELGRNYPNTVSILGDAKVTLQRLIDVVERKSADSAKAWTGRIAQLVGEWRTEINRQRTSDAAPIRPERICGALSEVLPANGVLVSDTGHAGMWTGGMVELTKPGQRYIRCAGSLGWGLPGAIGVKCALPDRPVICFTGDGGAYYHLAELETAARYGISVVFIVNNNIGLNQEIPIVDAIYGGGTTDGDDIWRFHKAVNFAKAAESLGCAGMRIEKPGELKDAIQHALGMNQPVVLEVVSDEQALAPTAWYPGR